MYRPVWHSTILRSVHTVYIHIYVFCVDLRINSDYFPIQHWLTGLYNRDGVCLLYGTDCILRCSSGLLPRSCVTEHLRVSSLGCATVSTGKYLTNLRRIDLRALSSGSSCPIPAITGNRISYSCSDISLLFTVRNSTLRAVANVLEHSLRLFHSPRVAFNFLLI